MNFSQLPLPLSLDKVFICSNLGRVRLELEGWSSPSQLRTVTVPGTREPHRRCSCSPLTNPVSHTAWPCSNIFQKNGSPIIYCTVLHLHILTYFTLSGFTLWDTYKVPILCYRNPCHCRTHYWHSSSTSSGQGPSIPIMANLNFWFSGRGVAMMLDSGKRIKRKEPKKVTGIWCFFSKHSPFYLQYPLNVSIPRNENGVNRTFWLQTCLRCVHLRHTHVLYSIF